MEHIETDHIGTNKMKTVQMRQIWQIQVMNWLFDSSSRHIQPEVSSNFVYLHFNLLQSYNKVGPSGRAF